MGFKRNEGAISQLKSEIREVFGLAMGILNQEFDVVIQSDNIFSDLGFYNQDIVDSGRLLNSKVVEVSTDKVRFSWNPKTPKDGYPYAAALYTGFLAFGKYPVVGRPWTDRAISRVNIPIWMVDQLRVRGLKAYIVRIE